MSATTKIVVLGGGYGGVEAAKKLNKQYRKNPNVEITLIDKNPYHTLLTELHEVAATRVEPEAVKVSFFKIFSGTKVKVVIDEIENIDFDGKKLKSDHYEYKYDYLVIGAGAQPEFFGIPGVQENCFTCWSLEDALRIRDHVEDAFRRAAREPDREKRMRFLNFTIAGGGFTGIELAGELFERRDILAQEYHIDPTEVRITVIEMKDAILPTMPVKLQKKSQKYLEKHGCDFMLSTRITGAKPGVVELEGQDPIKTETFIWTAGVHGSEFTSKVNLTKGSVSPSAGAVQASPEGIHGMAGCSFEEDEMCIAGERGRIKVNEYMQSVDYENVFMVGDMIWFVENETVLPQIVETALQTAHFAAHNIIADMERKPMKAFKSNYHGHMVSLGSKVGVAHVGGMSMSGFLALGVKHLINLHYLFGVAGVNAVWEYIRGQFLDVKNGRTITREHLSYKIPVYWALPLRVWLGYKWLSEGLYKVSTGWLNPGPNGILQPSSNNIFLPALTDEISTATSATPGGMGHSGVWQTSILSEPIALYEWFAETILSIHPLVAYGAQIGAVIAQVFFGVCLILGLFTFLAAAGSIAMAGFFIVSGWGNVELYWYMSAALVLMGGAGRGLGLDHYVMRWLKNWWNSTWIAKRTYLYTGEPRP